MVPQPQVTVAFPVKSPVVQQANANAVNVKAVPAPFPTATVKTAAQSSPTVNAVNAKSQAVEAQTSPQPKQNGTEVSAAPQNKSWASLFNKSNSEEVKRNVDVVVNGCGKAEESAVVAEERDDEFAAIKKDLKAKYDDPTFFRVGGETV